ncbi:hypothetical protein [Wenxinia saemankumensis]|uniref:Tetratricopeptide repeat-like domain-containing protein n=1 Tax=Wenxinia saemankumensis TaxID=1447782 RepID=A0A1M6EPR5_9RHOB|nr:hypothetical protein [Wenxinia saemankumensis]SHI87349.1 hypothetical protein SAMN05444417_2106 [Wenxinia saemankumensis]
MANQNDSFIDEVSEEVRRDRLFALMKRWGWIPAVIVVALVGGTAWQQWSAARDRAEAEALGDAVLAAVSEPDAEARIAALEAVPATGEAGVLARMLVAAEQQVAGEADAAIETLDGIVADAGVPRLYRDLAALKSAMIEGGSRSSMERRALLQDLAGPGAPFALLAGEQLALIEIAEGETEAALTRLRGIADDALATQSLRERAQGLIVALETEADAGDAAGMPDAGE